ncbi:SatD family protein [Tumebacillus avium]|uniref:SatD family protein n=1 Tax=Tumebacillus avium TaxID=1903704 RepID=UPI0012FDAF88|nr:SatD family protein [Tumebacillus avium]
MENYCAMIFDIQGSKKLSNRSEVQFELIDTINDFNNKHKDFLVSDFNISVGDEWQGLLKDKKYYPIVQNFFAEKLSVPFYTGVGVGPLTVFSSSLPVNQLDGPCFHKAREALELAKSKKYKEVLLN